MGVVRIVRRYPVIIATIVVAIVVVVLSATGAAAAAKWLSIAFVSVVIAWTVLGMIRDVMRGHVGLDILAVIAMVATLAVGEHLASLVIVLMLSGGEALEDYASRRAKRELTALLDRSPQRAHVLVHPNDPSSAESQDADVDDVRVDDVLLVRPSEIVPVDGVLVAGGGSFDESSLTGESMPVSRTVGDEVLSGSVNGSQAVRVRVIRRAADSQYQQVVALVRSAQESRAPMVRLADRFAIPFTLVSLVIAGAAWAISGTPVRFAEVLVLATPCPLLIAAPVAFLGGLSRTARAGVIVKGGQVLEQLARVRSAAFDKTGTLTLGAPRLVGVHPESGFDADELLTLAASAEEYSTHVLAAGIHSAAVERGLVLRPATAASEQATNGVTAIIDSHTVVVGKSAFVAQIAPETERAEIGPGQAAAYVAIDGAFAGVLVLADAVRPESAAVVGWLRRTGVERLAMLTGDARSTAHSIAERVGIDEVHAELLPAEKVALAGGMQPRPVMMVGDGVNDAPVLAAADVGVAMGARGSTAAGEAADAVVLKDSLTNLADAIAISRHTLQVAYVAIGIGIALSIGLMLVATTGVIPAIVGAFVQEGVDLATILYALRALRAPVADLQTPAVDGAAIEASSHSAG
ncbi:heavy metal translocating P-type ATPase [Microbacterium terrisoli]|uniref:heavy metal translocating P-type ATPase n=1 Tax=Microbacterium terrisoli TaxID=3242192 RepID=UPI00280546FF|nr:heavy metal translocating P-type ATPase [Microbacterium protaetiae]